MGHRFWVPLQYIWHRQKAGDSGRTPPEWSIECVEQEEQVEQVAHASGVRSQGGKRKRPQDRGQAVADPGQEERGGAARWWMADAVAAGSRAAVGWHRARRRSSQEGPGRARQQFGAYNGARRQEAGQDRQVRAEGAGGRLGRGSGTPTCGRRRGPKRRWATGQEHGTRRGRKP